MGRILVVDDEPEIGQILRLVLERRGHTVLVAGDGGHGLTAVRRQRPDLIVLDLLMSGVDGFTMLRQLDAGAKTAAAPVVVLTAVATSAARERCTELGASAFITKPFDPFEVADEIQRLMATQTPAAEESLGHRIRAFRLAAGYSQGEFEALSGIPKPRISRYETGHVTPSVATLQRIAAALDIPPERLLGRDIDLVEVFRLRLKARGVTLASVERARELADEIADAGEPHATSRTR